MSKVLISACLMGEKVRYDGGHVLTEHPFLKFLKEQDLLVPLCPECLGGMPVPRPPVEIQQGTGADVLAGKAVVEDRDGNDHTEAMMVGARTVLKRAEAEQVVVAVLKANSPSCGSDLIYDGGFSGGKIPGSGVTAALLQAHGIRVFHENQLESFAAFYRERFLNTER